MRWINAETEMLSAVNPPSWKFPWIRVYGIFQHFSSELNVDQYDRNDENWTRGLKMFADPQLF